MRAQNQDQPMSQLENHSAAAMRPPNNSCLGSGGPKFMCHKGNGVGNLVAVENILVVERNLSWVPSFGDPKLCSFAHGLEHSYDSLPLFNFGS